MAATRWTEQECIGPAGDGEGCPNGGKKGPKQANLSRCYRCALVAKKLQKKRQHEKRVVGTYGLELGDYDLLYEGQGGRCYICQVATGASKRLATDHDHAIEDLGRPSVRGLLCGPCNKMIGMSRDNPEFFQRAVEYLRNPPAWEILGTGEAAIAAHKLRSGEIARGYRERASEPEEPDADAWDHTDIPVRELAGDRNVDRILRNHGGSNGDLD